MSKLSPNFSRSEFACKCGCGFDTVDVALLVALEEIRAYFKSPVTITSGCRCADYNEKIGGAKNSQHVRGRAADIKINGVVPWAVAERAREVLGNYGGIGTYDTFVHIDTRSDGPARWVK